MPSANYSKTAKVYASLGIRDSFYLAYRDLPKLFQKYVCGMHALDYGCGAGKSTRYLRSKGFDVRGIDTNAAMLKEARKEDPLGTYDLTSSTKLLQEKFDLIFCASVFEEIATRKELVRILKEMYSLLKKDGKIIVITGTPDAYFNNWSSFIGKLPGNKVVSGSIVRVQIRGTDLILRDHLWLDTDHHAAFKKAGLRVLSTSKPLAKRNDPFRWYSEKKKPIWVVYVLGRAVD